MGLALNTLGMRVLGIESAGPVPFSIWVLVVVMHLIITSFYFCSRGGILRVGGANRLRWSLMA